MVEMALGTAPVDVVQGVLDCLKVPRHWVDLAGFVPEEDDGAGVGGPAKDCCLQPDFFQSHGWQAAWDLITQREQAQPGVVMQVLRQMRLIDDDPIVVDECHPLELPKVVLPAPPAPELLPPELLQYADLHRRAYDAKEEVDLLVAMRDLRLSDDSRQNLEWELSSCYDVFEGWRTVSGGQPPKDKAELAALLRKLDYAVTGFGHAFMTQVQILFDPQASGSSLPELERYLQEPLGKDCMLRNPVWKDDATRWFHLTKLYTNLLVMVRDLRLSVDTGSFPKKATPVLTPAFTQTLHKQKPSAAAKKEGNKRPFRRWPAGKAGHGGSTASSKNDSKDSASSDAPSASSKQEVSDSKSRAKSPTRAKSPSRAASSPKGKGKAKDEE